MSLMDRFSVGFQLMKDSISFISHEKDLVLYPVLTAITYVFILLFMGVGVAGGFLTLESLGISQESFDSQHMEIAAFGILFVYYTLAATATTFFSAGLVYCSIERFRGNNATIRDGLRRAWQSKMTIFKYGLVSAVVGILFRILERKFKNAGRLLSFLGGVAWAVATFFIVPAILYSEQDSLTEIVKDSATTFKDLWGETASARLGIGIFLMAFLLVTVVPLAGLVLLIPSLLIPVGLLYGLIVLVSLAYFQVAVSVIKASLYMYAMTGTMPGDFQDTNPEELTIENKRRR